MDNEGKKNTSNSQLPTSVDTWWWWFQSQCMQHQSDRVIWTLTL